MGRYHVSPQAAPLMDMDSIAALIEGETLAPDEYSVATILRLVAEQSEPRNWSSGLLLILPIAVIAMGVAEAVLPLQVRSNGLTICAGLVGLVACLVLMWRNRVVARRENREADSIRRQAVSAIKLIAKQPLRHRMLHEDRLRTGRSLIRIGGPEYRQALAHILDNSEPEEPLVVPSSL
jgi:hypothetical protein